MYIIVRFGHSLRSAIGCETFSRELLTTCGSVYATSRIQCEKRKTPNLEINFSKLFTLSSVFPSDRRCRIRELFSNNSRRIRQNFRKRMYHGCVKMFRKRRTSVSLHRWCCVVDFYFSATLVKIRRDEFSTGNSGEILFAALVGTTSIPKLDSTRSGRVTLPIGSR